MHPGVEFHAVRGVVELVLDENKITNGVNFLDFYQNSNVFDFLNFDHIYYSCDRICTRYTPETLLEKYRFRISELERPREDPNDSTAVLYR